MGIIQPRVASSELPWGKGPNLLYSERVASASPGRLGGTVKLHPDPTSPPKPACLSPHTRQPFQPMGHVKLHIPGPVEVSEKTFRAFCSPMIGHRGQGFKDLYVQIQPQLQSLFCTKQLVFLSTSSAWGVMEGAVRNLVSKKVLNCMCGAFSDKWLDVSKRCGKEAEALQVPWGSPICASD